MSDAEPAVPADRDDEAADYVLGTLDRAQRRDLERRLPLDAALRRAVDAWEARLHGLTALAPPIEPPVALWQRIEHSLGHTPAVAAHRTPAASRWQAWWTNLALWRTLAAGGVAAALLLTVRPGWGRRWATPSRATWWCWWRREARRLAGWCRPMRRAS